ncbi:hypothetical protein FNV43_RR07699 [Rhamnella rubrinervis]|uniref:Uncharacterized protein n=1 Tax=Rhamnella rubrinervis TaxID=2594499 RepID=A0A8K0HH34_9ROSA|nr:hypothetical protein FNV43_RR07699 [Rhamnella rubrinervis]
MGAKGAYCSVLCLFYIFLNYCHAISNITQSQALYPGQTIVSPSQTFELGFFSPNNSQYQFVGIWYKKIYSQKVVVWVANRENYLSVTDSHASLVIGSNGDLNLVDGRKRSVWSTNIGVPSNNSVAELSDNGNFILKDGITGEILWRSFDHPANTLLPGSVLGFNVKTGEKTMLTSWKSESNPSLGQFTAGLSPQTPPEAFVWINGSIPHWRSGPWDKSKFTGVHEMDSSYLSAFELEGDLAKGTINFSFAPYGPNSSFYMSISSEGVLRLMQKDQYEDYWYTNWEAPNGTCEVYGACGPFAVCKASESRICSCLKGFLPKSNEEWSKGNWTSGCIRRTKLLCDKNSSNSVSSGGKKDGFWKKGKVKLPDFYEYVPFMDDESCYTWCQNNCSCLAYTFVNGIGCLVWSKDLVDILEFSSGGEDLLFALHMQN